MNIVRTIKEEVNDASKWFTIAMMVLVIVYLSLWCFTIHTSNVQKANGIDPVLPIVPEDSQEFAALSQSLLSGNGFVLHGQLETTRTPGYPVFVAVIEGVTNTFFSVTFIQILLVFLSACIIRRLGGIFSSKKVGEIAAILFLINPVSIALSLVILTDTLFLFLFILGFYLAVSLNDKKVYRQIGIISIIFAYAIYVRPMGLFALPIFIAPLIVSKLSWNIRWKSIGLMVCILILALAPWVVRNYVRTGVPNFTSFEAINLSFAVTKFESNLHGTSIADENKAFEKATGVPESSWRDLTFTSHIDTVAEQMILQHPFGYLKYHILTSVPFLFPSTIAFSRDVYNSALHQKTPFGEGVISQLAAGDIHSFIQGILQVWWKFVERLLWLLVCAVVAYEVWIERKRPLTWAFLFIVVYLMLLSGPAAGSRYSFQAWPYMFILFTAGAISLRQRITQRMIQRKK